MSLEPSVYAMTLDMIKLVQNFEKKKKKGRLSNEYGTEF